MKFPFFNITIPSSHFPSSPLYFPFYKTTPTSRKQPPRWVRMDSSSSQHQKDKIVVIMGATGCGKTRLSIDLATTSTCFQSEIINSDKMQVYKGLDITTNKITPQERRGAPHHLLGEFDPDNAEFSPSDFRFYADLAISDIVSRRKLPLLVGGSNSFIHALLVDRFNPELNVFDFESLSNPVSTQLRYNCCFIWVDVSLPLLCDYLCRRVDEMLDSGMFEELSEYYKSVDPASQPGLRKAIGVPEFDRYFASYPPGGSSCGCGGEWDGVRRGVYEEAVRMIKENTCRLAKRQMMKIMRLKNAGWDLHRVDASGAFKQLMEVAASEEEDDGEDDVEEVEDYYKNNKNSNNIVIIKKKKKRKKKKKWMEIWEREVLKPSMKIVNEFLDE